jgi:hypothetical protein
VRRAPANRTILGWSFALVAAAAFVAGCSGSKSVDYVNPSAPTAAPLAAVSVSIALPLGNAGPQVRRARPFSLSAANVQSVTVQAAALGQQQPPTVIATTKNASNCRVSGQTLKCLGSVQAPVGASVTFSIVTYTQPNAQGTPLASGTLTLPVGTSGTSLVIDSGVLSTFALFIASLVVSVDRDVFPAGTPGEFTFTFAAYDASGNPIGAPATFANPIAVSYPGTNVFGFIPHPGASPNYQNEPLPPVTVPGTSLSFEYSGLAPGFNPGANPFTFPVAVPGVPARDITGNSTITILLPTPSPEPSGVASLTPSPIPTTQPSNGPPTAGPSPPPTYTPGPITLSPSTLYFEAPSAPPQTITASEPGVNTFGASILNPSIATVSPANGTVFTVTPVSPGATLVTVTDAKGNKAGVIVYVNLTIVNPGVLVNPGFLQRPRR